MNDKLCYMVTLALDERGNFFDISLSKFNSNEISKVCSFVYPYTSELFKQIQQNQRKHLIVMKKL